MENSLHHLLMTNHTAFRKRIFSALKNEGLTSGQPKVLEYLAEHDGAMQKDIAAACRIEPATMTSLLCGMEKKGLITRSAPDRRSLSVYLTEKGRMLIPLIKEEFSRIEDRALVKRACPEVRAVAVGDFDIYLLLVRNIRNDGIEVFGLLRPRILYLLCGRSRFLYLHIFVVA